MTARHLTPFLLFAILGLVPPAADAQRVSYTFTKLVDTTPVGGFDCGAPALNDMGTVAFECSAPPTFGGTLYRSDGRTITTIGEGPFGLCGVAPSINNRGQVAFINCDGVFVGDGGPPTLIVAWSGAFGETPAVSINDDGIVAFQRFDGVFVAGPEGIATIADMSGPFRSFCDTFQCSPPAITKRGKVAFSAVLDSGGSGLFVGAPSRTRPIISGVDFLQIFAPMINDEGTAAFVVNRVSTADDAILVGDGTRLSTLVDTATGPFDALWFPSINNQGTVAFGAYLNEFRDFGIFTGPDPTANRVVATGDALLGSILTAVGFFREGLNNNGQVAFSARFADGTSAIVLADPFTPVKIDVKPGSSLNRISLSSKDTIPVAILSGPQFDARTVDPETLTLSAGVSAQIVGRTRKALCHKENVNDDGRPDLVCQFVRTKGITLAAGETVAVLDGRTVRAGTRVRGEDSVTIVP